MWWGFDPLYFLFVAPAMLLAVWAQYRVRSAFSRASHIPSESGLSGAQAAAALLHETGVDGVAIEPAGGFLTDHYVPGRRLALSPDVYAGRSLAAVGVAAHECGHAMQDARRYPLLVMRNFLVPVAGIGGNLAWIIFFAGLLLSLTPLVWAGIVVFSTTVLFQMVNLPVEFDASRPAAGVALREAGLISSEEDREVRRVLDAAALTYVAATLTSVLTLLYFLFRSGLLGGRR